MQQVQDEWVQISRQLELDLAHNLVELEDAYNAADAKLATGAAGESQRQELRLKYEDRVQKAKERHKSQMAKIDEQHAGALVSSNGR